MNQNFSAVNYADVSSKLVFNKAVTNEIAKTINRNAYSGDNADYNGIQNNLVSDDYYSGGQSSLAIGGLQMDNTPVSEMYFSRENMNRIQKQIKKEVYRLSNGKFILKHNQDETDLLVAMRAVFLDHSNNLPEHIVSQVKELNIQTLKYIIPDMMSNIKQQLHYLKDIDQPIQTMDRPLNVNRAGRKTLPSVATVWGF